MLELGLSFCPTFDISKFEMSKDVILFACRLLLKALHANTNEPIPGREPWKGFRAQNYRNVKMLFELLQDNPEHPQFIPLENTKSTLPKLQTHKKKSTSFPPLHLNNSVNIFVREVLKDIRETQFQEREIINLNSYQKNCN